MIRMSAFHKAIQLETLTVLSTMMQPVTSFAAEVPSDGTVPLYKDVADMLDADEVVVAHDHEVSVGSTFDIARKYGIDYSLKKDVSTDPPRFMVFFKAKDVDVMTAAFKEYAGVSMKQKVKKPSVKKKLAKTVQRKVKHRQRVKQKNKDRGQDR